MPIDRTQPPVHFGTIWGFWNDGSGPLGQRRQSGSGHDVVHYGIPHPSLSPTNGYIDGFGLPATTNGMETIKWASYDPWAGTAGSVIPPPPPPPDEPPPPPVIEVVDTPLTEPCPIGYYRAVVGPDVGKCVLGGPQTPPVVTPPVMGTDLRLMNGKFNVTCRYDASERGAGAGPALAQKYSEASGAFTFFDVAKWEVVVSYATAAGGLMVSAMTDVQFILTVKNLQTGEEKTFNNPAGHLLGVVVVIA